MNCDNEDDGEIDIQIPWKNASNEPIIIDYIASAKYGNVSWLKTSLKKCIFWKKNTWIKFWEFGQDLQNSQKLILTKINPLKVDPKGEEIDGTLYEKELQKKNQKRV